MSEHEGDIKNHNSKEGSGEKKFSSGSGESFKDWYDNFRKKEKAKGDKSGEAKGRQGEKKEEPKKEKKIVSEGKQSKDIIRLFRNFISLPVNQTPEMFQFALDSAKKEYSKGKISEKQFKELERSVKDRLSQLGREKIDSKKQFHEEAEPKDTSEKEIGKGKEEDKKTTEEKTNYSKVEEYLEKRKAWEEEFRKLSMEKAVCKDKGKEFSEEKEKRLEELKLLSSGPLSKEEQDIFSKELKEFEKEIPDFRKEFKGNGNLKEFKEWFMNRVYALHEEYANERFDTNFTLTWPLQQALNKLWPVEGDKDVNVEGRNMAEEISKVRKELTSKFEAHRNFHNSFIYLYKRISGVAGAVEASTLVDVRQIEILMKDPQVAHYLRKYEVLGEECRNLYDEKFELDMRKGSINEKDVKRIGEKIDKKTKEAQELQIGREDGEDIEKDRWAAIVAGGIYSALHQAGKHNLVMNTGDFFIGRLFNVDTKVKELWEGSWKRAPNKELYQALELGSKNYWQEFLEKRVKNLPKELEKGLEELKKSDKKSDKEFIKKLNKVQTDRNLNKKERDEKILQLYFKKTTGIELFGLRFGKEGELKFDKYSLKEAKFDKLDFKEMEDNSLTRMDVELLDADSVRKLILKPKQFVARPSGEKLAEMVAEFQHLKGSKASSWFKGVLRQLCYYYQDETAPEIENLPLILRKCRAQEINSDYRGWSNALIESRIGAFAPPLTDKDKEELLREFVGTKFERNFSKAWKNIALVTGFIIWGGVKGFFEGFFKYLSSEKR